MLKPWYRVRTEPDRVLLEYGQRLVALEGGAANRLLPALLPRLDGRRTVDEIVAELGEPIAPATTATLAALARAGALTTGPPLEADLPEPVRETAALLAATSADDAGPVEIARRLRGSSVAVLGASALAEDVVDLLRRSGIGSVERPEAGAGDDPWPAVDLVLAAPSPAEPELLERLNRTALGLSRPWLPLPLFDGAALPIGPLVVPRESACWECVRLRRGAAIGYADELPLLEQVSCSRPTSPALGAIAAGLAVTLALRWLVQRDPALPGLLLALEQWPRPSVTSHVVYRVPRCPECSGLAAHAAPAPWSEEAAA
jgi:bacteriocin biosynthesis cyclodehydratase domain-containing protein